MIIKERKNITDYWSPYADSKLVRSAYDKYVREMASDKHIGNDIQTFTMLFWDLFENEEEREHFKKIVFHFFAVITNFYHPASRD